MAVILGNSTPLFALWSCNGKSGRTFFKVRQNKFQVLAPANSRRFIRIRSGAWPEVPDLERVIYPVISFTSESFSERVVSDYGDRVCQLQLSPP
jgi:hypothetical protein